MQTHFCFLLQRVISLFWPDVGDFPFPNRHDADAEREGEDRRHEPLAKRGTANAARRRADQPDGRRTGNAVGEDDHMVRKIIFKYE